MFYSETLLSKTGALARVWLSANLERKLSKKDIRDTNIESSVHAIVDQGQAPLALRLSGQLLLGVVRIYSRKARYLLDDCTEAINKIRMTFRTGNNDRSTNDAQPVNPASLTLQDVLTEMDLNAPFGDPSLLLSQALDDSLLAGLNLASQPLGSIDLDGDLSSLQATPSKHVSAIERARAANTPRKERQQDDTIVWGEGDDIELVIDGGDDDDLVLPEDSTFAGVGGEAGLLDDLVMEDDAGFDNDAQNGADISMPSARANMARDRDASMSQPDNDNEINFATAPNAPKRRKVIHADTDTMIRSNRIQAMQTDHPDILKPASFLPKDPVLLALMEMQRNGGFVSNILGDGRSKGWAPELRGILSLEVIRQPLKRKRDTAPAPRRSDAHAEAHVETNDDTTMGIDQQNDMDAGFGAENEINFDETTVPPVHPAESGPVSQGTKHAVHLLRERFGADAAESPNKRQQTKVLFQDLLPERTTTRADATKLFFECLVLATKDAVKVDQPTDKLGGPLHVRARRGLWGDWAEMEAGGEIAAQEEEEA